MPRLVVLHKWLASSSEVPLPHRVRAGQRDGRPGVLRTVLPRPQGLACHLVVKNSQHRVGRRQVAGP